MLGAAYATLAAYVLLMVVRTWNAQKIYPVAYQWRRVVVLLLAAGALTATRRGAAAVAAARVRPHARVSRSLLAPLGFYLPAERKRLQATASGP